MLTASISAERRSLHSTFGPVSITFEFLEHTANKTEVVYPEVLSKKAPDLVSPAPEIRG